MAGPLWLPPLRVVPPPESGDSSLECETPGCRRPTNDGKPHCKEHVGHMAYVRELEAKLGEPLGPSGMWAVCYKGEWRRTVRPIDSPFFPVLFGFLWPGVDPCGPLGKVKVRFLGTSGAVARELFDRLERGEAA